MLDLDGTLTDPYEGITKSVAWAFTRLGHPVPTAEALRGFIGPPLQDSFAARLPADLVEPAVTAYRARFDQSGWCENRVYDGIAELLAELAHSGQRLAVVTSKPSVFAERILVHFELRGHFERVVGATFDGALRHKEDLIRMALADAGVHGSDAVMVGDRAQDVIGAKANGVRSIGVTWGYADPGELESAGADLIIDEPAQLTHVDTIALTEEAPQ